MLEVGGNDIDLPPMHLKHRIYSYSIFQKLLLTDTWNNSIAYWLSETLFNVFYEIVITMNPNENDQVMVEDDVGSYFTDRSRTNDMIGLTKHIF